MIDPYIRQYGKRLYGLCRALCADVPEAEDLYQETWLRALKNFSRYDPRRPFEPWLTKICVNSYRNALRRIARSPLLNFRTNGEKDAMLASIPAPAGEDYAALHEAIRKLPEKLRLTVILFYFHDMDIKAVAATEGVPEGTVKSRLHKARKRLKEALDDEADL